MLVYKEQYLPRKDWLSWLAVHVPMISEYEQARQQCLRECAITEELMNLVLLPLEAMSRQRYHQCTKRPFIIGIAGCVAVGKSTLARALHALLAAWMGSDLVAYCSTDDFLYPNAMLDSQGLSHRKGFPDSYDLTAMRSCFQSIRRGEAVVTPVYSHASYDRLTDQQRHINQPSLLIVEGVNALSWGVETSCVDWGVFLEADLMAIEGWFIRRAEKLAVTEWMDPSAYFYGLSRLYPEQLREYLVRVWQDTNLLNYEENIVIERSLADCVITKNADHSLRGVWLRGT